MSGMNEDEAEADAQGGGSEDVGSVLLSVLLVLLLFSSGDAGWSSVIRRVRNSVLSIQNSLCTVSVEGDSRAWRGRG